MARAEFDEVLKVLRTLPSSKWAHPDYKALKGHAVAGIGEIRFKADKKQYRPLGFFLDGESQETFVLLVGAYKKEQVWTPHDALDTAIERRKDVLRDRSYVGDYVVF